MFQSFAVEEDYDFLSLYDGHPHPANFRTRWVLYVICSYNDLQNRHIIRMIMCLKILVPLGSSLGSSRHTERHLIMKMEILDMNVVSFL